MRKLVCSLAAAAGVVGASTAVGAQQNRCVVAFDSVGTYAQTNRPDGSRLERMGGGVSPLAWVSTTKLSEPPTAIFARI